jgi:CO/xanthine dehydrogenase Mo-binding subunit
MLHARVIRPSARGAQLEALADGALPGDARLLRDGNFLAVLASTEWDAEAAAARIAARASWQEADTLPEQMQLTAWLRDAAVRGERKITEERDAEVSAAAHRLKRSFHRPYLAHASIGPSCAVAQWQGDMVEVFSHTQGPYNLRADIAKTLRCPPGKVIIRHMEGSGCYGHNGADDVALEAVLIARAAEGRPVRLLWSRADELGWAPFSPAMLVDIEVAAAADGTLLEWH